MAEGIEIIEVDEAIGLPIAALEHFNSQCDCGNHPPILKTDYRRLHLLNPQPVEVPGVGVGVAMDFYEIRVCLN